MRYILLIFALFILSYSNDTALSYAHLSDEEKSYLLKKSEIKMCIDPDWMPFEKIEEGMHIGMTADYFKIFSKKISIPIVLVPTKTWTESLEFAKDRKCDILSLAMSTADRTKYMNFTQAYLKAPLVIITQITKPFIDDPVSVISKPLGITKGYAFIEILKKKYPNINLVEFETLQDGLNAVRRGKIFAYIDNLISSGYSIQKEYIGELKVAGKFETTWQWSVGVRNDDSVLLSIFEKIISSVKSEEYRDVMNKWISVQYESKYDYELFLKVAAGMLLLIVMLALRHNTLKKYTIKLEEKEKELEQLSAAKSLFLANMSHEIRTPLNAILGFINLLKKESQGRSTSLEYIDIVENSSKTLLNIIEDILDFSKIESGKISINLVDFNLKDELGSITHLFDAKCSEKNITLSLIFEDNLPEAINSDAYRIKQVISNLLSNAIKFTQSDKNIYVRVGFKDNYLRVSVVDEGKGISSDKLTHIFLAFNQEDNSTTREFGGTGLGLSISSELVKLLGGELKVKSSIGVGSEFYFSIPAKIVKDVVHLNKGVEELSFSNEKILVVEDNRANQLFMKILLQEMNLTFDIANDGVEAVEMFKTNKYEVILMDENMPNLNGIGATKKIIKYEKENELMHTPIIALTANALKGDKEKFLNAGMDEYMTKPLERKVLTTKLLLFLKH
ncbi:transporter substrate-binding domain-containing protein [Sulfurimonas aquatica]|uniref:histidine kinase n=1 Tax=Sulfurimonas aquatica TaxID=2672570 RepID=A0A975AZI2_9BACT|nr:transporter substrate-binding domain-containing protein [Sulfurimonas aquatica]QSZ41464.1 transporter substrate-binding domain-containing protein [Sulfurimonas aquatica]